MRNRLLLILGGLAVVGAILYFTGIRMTKSDLHISAAAEPLACIGGERVGEFCSPGTFIPITNSLIMTVLIDLLLLAVALAGARNMKLVPTGLQNIVEAVVEAVYNFARGIDAKNVAKFFPLPATILLFFLFGNMLALVPGIGSIGNCVPEVHAEAASPATEGAPATVEGQAGAEAHEGPSAAFGGLPGYCEAGNFIIPWLRAPAADLNVSFAFAIAAVFMVEFFGFQALGLGYLGKFFNFREGFIPALVGILELFSELMRLLAFAFRIFGNIFGGEVVLVVMAYLFPYLLPLPFYGLEVFVALIQALLFAILTLIFFSLAVQAHGHDESGHAEPIEAADSVARAVH
jgi:F-type H+-transporting ATPase subunit a